MRLGIVNSESWAFLRNIADSLARQYPTAVYHKQDRRFPVLQHRLSLYLFRYTFRRFLRRQDVVLVEWANDMLAEAAVTRPAPALVTRLHRYEMFKWVDQVNWPAVNYVVLDSQAMRTKLLARTAAAPERTVVISPVGIAPENMVLQPRPWTGQIGILCDLAPRKRVYELILAFGALRREEPALRLHIGGGENAEQRAYYEALLRLVERLGLAGQVQFHGPVQDRWAWYRQMDILVSFSYSEGMQVAPLEAAVSGCYCLSHWWEGAEEAFPQEQLFFTEGEFVARVRRYCQAGAAPTHRRR